MKAELLDFRQREQWQRSKATGVPEASYCTAPQRRLPGSEIGWDRCRVIKMVPRGVGPPGTETRKQIGLVRGDRFERAWTAGPAHRRLNSSNAATTTSTSSGLPASMIIP